MNLITKQAKINMMRAKNKQIKDFILEKWNKRESAIILETTNKLGTNGLANWKFCFGEIFMLSAEQLNYANFYILVTMLKKDLDIIHRMHLLVDIQNNIQCDIKDKKFDIELISRFFLLHAIMECNQDKYHLNFFNRRVTEIELDCLLLADTLQSITFTNTQGQICILFSPHETYNRLINLVTKSYDAEKIRIDFETRLISFKKNIKIDVMTILNDHLNNFIDVIKTMIIQYIL